MKHINKKQEPIEFTNWKKQDKMFQRGNPKWNRVPSSIKDNIRASLKEEQGYICCYCERKINDGYYHIEHFKPKDKNRFPELQLSFDNLLCSCQSDLEKGEPRHCGNSKGSWFDDTLLISPLDSNCESKFSYTADGHIKPSYINDSSAVTTIEKLNLDIDKLVDLRKKAIEPFIDENLNDDELRNFVNGYLVEKEDNNGKYNEFFTTIKYLFEN